MDPITRDFYEERRCKWRRSAFWRGVLVTLLSLFALSALAAWAVGGKPRQPHIARIHVDNVIYTDLARDRILAEMAETGNIRALIVHIDSPGGTVVGAEALYDSLNGIAADVPVVAVMDGVAASGGYLAALAADHVIARGNTVTGSIGVILEYLTFTGLMDRVGVDLETIRSSDLKAAPSPLRKLSPAARALEQRMVDETQAWFTALVAEERGLDGAALESVTDGRTFTGRMALRAGLIDALGDEADAVAWLESRDAELAGLPVKTWKIADAPDPLAGLLARLAPFGADYPAGGTAPGPRLMAILK
ncbi:signal peptide peptidase SppA [Rhodobacteraceae bacterium 2CG4]|uniref:Signal peptide peptidase SppA n=1 Tax=Halovulum marinum TaxID=2662447 RepID=A0A6L5Z6W3_9RHOB|nr:signal peptide peptidase SppA [Halovulum marinum]MSU92308.1 signal peptide peptidase SppA [Halovulum marinum]